MSNPSSHNPGAWLHAGPPPILSEPAPSETAGQAPTTGAGGVVGLLSDVELRAILLTCDGRGKAVKTQAIETLLNRRFPSGVKDMPASAYLDEEPNIRHEPRAPTT